MDRAAAETWIRAHASPVAPIETAHERPWSTVLRVPVDGRPVWFKACAPVQAFEPRLTAELFARWGDLVPEVVAYDEERAWLLLGDAGTPLRSLGNPPVAWLEVMPLYAQLQRGETAHADDHLAHGVPDLRLDTLPARYVELLRADLPIDGNEVDELRRFSETFAEWCARLASAEIPPSVQHDDLHMANVYADGHRLRVLDWGDSSIAHPFTSLLVTFRFLEELNGLAPDDPWFARIRDAYLEPWGTGLGDTFTLALRVGCFAHVFAWLRQRDHLSGDDRRAFDERFPVILRRALVETRR